MYEDSSIIRQRVIDRDYSGDVNAYNRAMAEKRKVVFRWTDIHANAVAFPEYEHEALRQIEFHLGYLPPRQVTLPHEPFIREALYRYDAGHRNFDKLTNDCQICINQIRVIVIKRTD